MSCPFRSDCVYHTVSLLQYMVIGVTKEVSNPPASRQIAGDSVPRSLIDEAHPVQVKHIRALLAVLCPEANAVFTHACRHVGDDAAHDCGARDEERRADESDASGSPNVSCA